MLLPFDALATSATSPPSGGTRLGLSRDGRPVLGWRFGRGDFRLGLIAGCHADEPVGPELLRRLVGLLGSLPEADDSLARFTWWIVPDANPDGAARNAAWGEPLGEHVEPIAYLRHAVREAPGDDVEFGFPRGEDDRDARPENRAIAAWWRTDPAPFRLHASLHGMAVARGPWFLVEGAWSDRCQHWMQRCTAETRALGYELHDVDRGGEKGFVRVGPGFTTRPDSAEMARHFREKGDLATASLFRPSSMEAVRSLGGDPLTLVSEMPLFLIPGPGGGGPSANAEVQEWKQRLSDLRRRLEAGEDDSVRRDLDAAGIVPMPIRDQMRLQWTMIVAGVEQLLAS